MSRLFYRIPRRETVFKTYIWGVNRKYKSMRNQLFYLLPLLVLMACSTQKTAVGNAAITDTYWRLTELDGKVVPPALGDKKQVYLVLKKENNQLAGFAGCNGFGGHYTLKEGSQLSFTNIMGTMMACDELKNENKLLDALRETDNYIHIGKKLLLNKGKKAPLARFEADYSR